MRKFLLSAATLFLVVFSASAQVVQVYPPFPNTGELNTIITYDATQGNGALVGVSPVYVHTGLITTQSTSTSNWFDVQGNWGTADPRVLMTSIGNNKWTFSFDFNSFYSPAVTDTILYMAFVFLNEDGSVVGRNADGSDIIVQVFAEDTFQMGFTSPVNNPIALPLDTTLSLTVATNRNCSSITLTEDNNLLSVGSDTMLTYNNFHLLHYGVYNFTATGVFSGDTQTTGFTAFVNPPIVTQARPMQAVEGINYIDDSTVILGLLAPMKSYVYVIGDFTNWQVNPNYLMKLDTDGQTWWLQVTHLTPGQEYIFQYLVDGNIRVGDPYSDKVSDPNVDINIDPNVYPNLISYPYGKTTGVASVLQTAQQPYQWQVTNFQRPSKNNLVIYELLTRDFAYTGSWPEVMDSLTYLANLGVTAIELMPIMNFESGTSWGYNPNYFTAPEKVYGTREDLRQLIDACHSLGMAVILDIPFNDAFGSNPMVMMYWDSVNQRPSATNPWFNEVAPHPFSVGYDFNHLSPYTVNFVTRVTRTWIRDYHVDGYRFDLTKGYTQFYSGNNVELWGEYDASRIQILEGMVDSIWAFDSTAYCVFEQLSENPEQQVLAAHGILLWDDENPTAGQASMGWNNGWDFSTESWEYNQWSQSNEVSYMESHDEERIMYENETFGDSVTGYDIKPVDTGLARMEMSGTVFFSVPGPKMIWMFGELGYDVSINANCRICNKPILWSYESVPNRLHLYKVWSALFHLKSTYPVFQTNNYTINLSGSIKSTQLTGNNMDVVTVGNFDMTPMSAAPGFQHTGWWYDYFTGDSMNVTNVNQAITYQEGEYHLYTDVSLPVPDLNVNVTSGVNNVTQNEREVILYPNPSQGIFNMAFDMGQGGDVNLQIYDISGQLVYTQHTTGSAGINFMQVNANRSGNLAPGIYFYRLSGGQSVYNGKISIVNE